jgi:hypothetical protein
MNETDSGTLGSPGWEVAGYSEAVKLLGWLNWRWLIDYCYIIFIWIVTATFPLTKFSEYEVMHRKCEGLIHIVRGKRDIMWKGSLSAVC